MPKTEQELQTLNSFLRGEISAVETYRQALDRISDDRLRPELEECQRDHEQRVAAIRERTSVGRRPMRRSSRNSRPRRQGPGSDCTISIEVESQRR